MSTTRPEYGQVDRAYGMRLATTPPAEDGPVWMVNLMRYHDVAHYADGNPDAISGQQADDRYAPVDVLRDIGAEVVFHGEVDIQLLGAQPAWDRVGVVKYPTRRSFIDMQSRPDFQAKHVHKEAGMAATIVMGCQPADVPIPAGIESTPWDQVDHPPTDDDGPVMVIHVIKYADGSGAQTMVNYQNKAAESASRHGASVAGWFDVEGTIVGDGRQWDQVRFNYFPSKAAFMAVVLDPGRIEAQKAFREPAMTDTYTMIVRPSINRMVDR